MKNLTNLPKEIKLQLGLLTGSLLILLALGVLLALDSFLFNLLMPVGLAIISGLMIWQWLYKSAGKRQIMGILAALIAGFILSLTSAKVLDYNYSETFGLTIFGASIIVCIIWLIVSLSAWSIASVGNISRINKYLLAGGLVLIFDLLLEQVGDDLGIWISPTAQTSMLSYVLWFVASLITFYFYEKTNYKKTTINYYLVGLLPVLAFFLWFMLLI